MQSSTRLAAGLLATTLAACTSTGLGSTELVRGAASAAPTSAALAAASAGAPAVVQRRLELELWNDPDFRQRFTESYLAETEVEPRLTEAEREALQQVRDMQAADQAPAALQYLAGLREEADSAVLAYNVGNLHFEQDSLNQSATAYRDAVRLFPKFRRAWRNMAIVLSRQSEFAGAAEAAARTIELGGADSYTYGLLGIACSNLGKHVAAESAFRTAMMLDPLQREWEMRLARAFFDQNRFTDAVSLCDAMLAEDAGNVDLWLLQANAYIGAGEALRASENYELVDRLGGSTTVSLATLGDIYVNEKLYGLAADAYSRAMSLDLVGVPDGALRAVRILGARAAVAPTRRLLAEIDAHYGARLTDDQLRELLKLEARMALIDGTGADQVGLLAEIVALDPFDGEALLMLGDYARADGDKEKALLYYERAASVEEFEADARVQAALVHASNRDYEQAINLFERAQSLRYRESVQDYLDRVKRVAKGL